MPITHQETKSGTVSSSSTVSVSSNIAGADSLYLCGVVIYGSGDYVTSISGGGLTWTALSAANGCSGRIDNNSTEIWWAYGSPGSSFTTTVTLNASAGKLTASVSRYTGTASTAPTGSAYENTNGLNGTCGGGADNSTPNIALTSTVNDSLHFVLTTPRNTTLSSTDSNYIQRIYIDNSSGGNGANLYIHERTMSVAGVDNCDHNTSSDRPWICSGCIIEPAQTDPSPGSCTKQCLFVGGAVTAAEGDPGVISHLEGMGWTVTYKEDTASATMDADGMDLIVISSTISSGEVGTKFTDVTIPLLNWEGALLDELGMATGESFPNVSSWEISDDTHQLAAGNIEGPVSVFSTSQSSKSGTGVAVAAKKIAWAGTASQYTIFAYETGAAMATGNAPARRGHFALNNNTFQYLTTKGTELFNAMIHWLDGGCCISGEFDCIGICDGPDTSCIAGDCTKKCLYIGSGVTPELGDPDVIAHLESIGWTVTYQEDSSSQTSDSNGMDLIVISSTTSSGNVNTKYTNVAIPIMTWEPALADDLGMAESGTFTEGVTNITITNNSHQAAAERDLGSIQVYSTAQSVFRVPNPVASATKIAHTGTSTDHCIFVCETGSALSKMAAPARRGFFFLHDDSFSALTNNGIELFNAMIWWLDEDLCCPSGYDCLGSCGGGTTFDCLGVCGGTATVDCAGTCEGTAVEDCLGNCEGTAVLDCFNVCNGGAIEDCDGFCKDPSEINILYLSGTSDSTGTDATLKQWFVDQGYNMTWLYWNNYNSSYLSGKDLVFASEQASGVTTGLNLKNVQIPVMTTSGHCAKNLGMASNVYTGSPQEGVHGTSHYLNGENQGATFTPYSSSSGFNYYIWSSFGPDVIRVTDHNNAAYVHVMAYEDNTEMASSFTCPHRRWAMGAFGYYNDWSEDAYSMLKRGIIWSVEGGCCPGMIDCAGLCGTNTVPDCAGVCGGSALKDCKGVCGGNATVDCAGNCYDPDTESPQVAPDCAGVCGGTAVPDCSGTCNGTAYRDCEGTCIKSDCTLVTARKRLGVVSARHFLTGNWKKQARKPPQSSRKPRFKPKNWR